MNGALIPHAPLLLEEVTPDREGVGAVLEAIAGIAVPGEALVVLATSHGGSGYVYERARGSLAGFGIAGVGVDAQALVPESLRAWGPVEDRPLDHGALVPMRLLGISDAVAVSVDADTRSVAGAIEKLAVERDVFVVCSAHTSARLTDRAPLPYSFDAVRLDARFVGDIETDCAAARDLADELVTIGGSCSGPTLKLFGELFAGRGSAVRAYGAPFGVGYPVVVADDDG